MLSQNGQSLLLLKRILCRQGALLLAFLAPTIPAHAQSNDDWINPGSGYWDVATNWSAGLPNADQSEVRITNANSKAVAIQPGTPTNSMTVQNLRLGGVAPDTNILLLNYFGTTTPLRVLNTFNIETNARVLMLYSGLDVSNLLNLNGVFDQEGGELDFTNSTATIMQIDGGSLNLTNGLVNGANLYLGGANPGYLNQDSGLVSLALLEPGMNPSLPGSTGAGTYLLRNGWLIVSGPEIIGTSGFGTLTQNGGTNSASQINVSLGIYVKNGGGLFAGDVTLYAPNQPIYGPPAAILTHAGGTATINNELNVFGQGNRHNPHSATFNMFGGSLSTARMHLEQGGFSNQTNGTVNVANDLYIADNATLDSVYYLSGGYLYTSNTSVMSSYPDSSAVSQSGGTHLVADTVSINGTAMYALTGGTLSAPNIKLTGSSSYPPQFFVNGAPTFAVTNQAISSSGGAIVIQDSQQQFGRLTLQGYSGINLAGNFAVLHFADSHTNSWSDLQGMGPQLTVYNWNGATNGGGTDQLTFGSTSFALTPSQVAQIHFVNPGGFPPATYPARILSTGEVVPMPLPSLNLQRNGNTLVITWTGGFTLQSATNVTGPYLDLTNATSPYSVDVTQLPMAFFRLRD